VTRTRRLSREELEPYLLEFPTEPGIVDLSKVFHNEHPVEIEVGCGKGLFLLTSALASPNTNFLGIELDRKYQLFTATRMAIRALLNVRMASADARTILAERLAPACCRRVHVYFPDPWWKTKHRKRRLFTPEFVRACERVLVPGGQLSIATDVAEYFEVILKLVAAESQLAVRELPPEKDEGFATNFERKAQLRGIAINRALYEKPPVSAEMLPGLQESRQSPPPCCNERPPDGENRPVPRAQVAPKD
jgi:tRNA (guanine-N7-)-methyltransferase